MRTMTWAWMILALPAPAIAQTPAAEISAGWSFLRLSDASGIVVGELENFPLGFHLGGAARFTDSFGIAGDFGWNRGESEGEVMLAISYTTFSAGPRFYFGDRVTGFVHALFGFIHTNGHVEFGESFKTVLFYDARTGEFVRGIPPLDVGESELMMQPGGGIDFRVKDTFAIRGQFDYQWFTGLDDSNANIRVVVAGVLYLGER